MHWSPSWSILYSNEEDWTNKAWNSNLQIEEPILCFMFCLVQFSSFENYDPRIHTKKMSFWALVQQGSYQWVYSYSQFLFKWTHSSFKSSETILKILRIVNNMCSHLCIIIHKKNLSFTAYNGINGAKWWHGVEIIEVWLHNKDSVIQGLAEIQLVHCPLNYYEYALSN